MKKILISTLILLFLFPSIPAKGSIAFPLIHKGVSYVTWNRDSFAGKLSDVNINSMPEYGINCVAVIPTWYQEEFNSTDIKRTDRTPTDSSIRHAIKKVHQNGMFVLLKPHIDMINSGDLCRSDIGFQKEKDWNVWFADYRKFILHYARMAEKENVEFFCVGTELSFAAQRTEDWKNIIIEVRKVFLGHITYAANWDEYKDVGFWSELDYAGIDAYFPLSKKSNPSYSEIKEGWKEWLADIETWQAVIDKPVVFTECGYCSSDIAAMKPWEQATSGSPNANLQADLYRAVFETFWDKPWFSGVYWWNWRLYEGAGGPSNRGFTPQNKLASLHMKTWFGKSGTRYASNPELDDKLTSRDAQTSERYTVLSDKIAFTGNMAKKADILKK